MKDRALFVFFAISIFVGNAQEINNLSRVGDFSDGLVAIEKDGKWAFMDNSGNIAIDFRDDLLVINKMPEFTDNRCLIKEVREGIEYYGYMDKTGQTVIKPAFLNATPFKDGHALAIINTRSVRGKNEYLNKDIVHNEFDEVVLNTQGDIVKYLRQIKGIIMTKGRYKQPKIESRFLSKDLLSVKDENGKWKIIKMK